MMIDRLSLNARRILSYLRDLSAAGALAPTYRQIARAIQFRSISRIEVYLDELEARGYIRRLPSRARAIELVSRPEESIRAVPLVFQDEREPKTIRVPGVMSGTWAATARHGEYAMTMKPGLRDGDVLLFDDNARITGMYRSYL